MWESLVQLDSDWVLAINRAHFPVLDSVMIFISEKWVWLPLYGFLLWIFLRPVSGSLPKIYLILAIAAGVALSDQTASAVLKPLFERLRPCHDPSLASLLHLPIGCGGKFGFASSHASNTAFLAIFFFLLRGKEWPWLSYLLLIWALVTGYSRIYLGAHFPGDVLVGYAIGAFWAFLLVRLVAPRLTRN